MDITTLKVLAVYVGIGLIGSGIELVGIKLKSDSLVALGKKLEALTMDMPKLLLGKVGP